MDSINIAKRFKEVCEKCDQESLLSSQPAMQNEILKSKNESNGFFMGLFFAIPLSLLFWGIIIWVFF